MKSSDNGSQPVMEVTECGSVERWVIPMAIGRGHTLQNCEWLEREWMASDSGRYDERWRQRRHSRYRPNQCSHTKVAMSDGMSAAKQLW